MFAEILLSDNNSNKIVETLTSPSNSMAENENNKRNSVGTSHNEIAKLVIIMKEGGEGASLDIASDITIGR